MKAEIPDVVDMLQLPLNSQVFELLTCFMDWISDHHLSKIKTQEEREDSQKPMFTQSSKNPCTQEKCIKVKRFGSFACVNVFRFLCVLNDSESITGQHVIKIIVSKSIFIPAVRYYR